MNKNQPLLYTLIVVTLALSFFSHAATKKTYSFALHHNQSSDEAVKASILAALEKRGWTVEESKPPKILATLNHRGIDGRLHIRYNATTVAITNDSYRQAISDDPRQFSEERMEPYYPRGWIKNLRVDIESFLPQMVNLKQETKIDDALKVKLEQLKSLHEDGLLSDEVYNSRQQSLLEEYGVE
ncbi:hypothetical protein ACFSJ3_01510 [Corallincola platygyrae]|uniref:SHOCT domain-containing protein n=1 Tax=Corallincola platygyrae TaxID=1193278 RepID=A0ABW4XIN9_9GAMM